MLSGRVIVILFVATVAAAAIGATIVMVRFRGDAYANQAAIGLREVHKAARARAEANDGTYPSHVALLWTNVHFRPSLLRDPRGLESGVWDVDGVDARPFMSEVRDVVAGEDRLDRSPLLAAVNRVDDEPLYRFGDYWFARLPGPQNAPALIFGWTQPDEQGRRAVVFDNGDVRRIDPVEWTETWEEDAAARSAHDLPALPIVPE